MFITYDTKLTNGNITLTKEEWLELYVSQEDEPSYNANFRFNTSVQDGTLKPIKE